MIAAISIGPALNVAADQAAESAATIAQIMETFARPSVDSGAAVDDFRAFSAPHMPGPYFYSDISTGLIGLILVSNANAPMGDDAVVSKNGGLAGFSTDLGLVPSLDLGVIVFINSNRNAGTTSGKKPVSAATEIADNIMYAIARSNLR